MRYMFLRDSENTVFNKAFLHLLIIPPCTRMTDWLYEMCIIVNTVMKIFNLAIVLESLSQCVEEKFNKHQKNTGKTTLML